MRRRARLKARASGENCDGDGDDGDSGDGYSKPRAGILNIQRRRRLCFRPSICCYIILRNPSRRNINIRTLSIYLQQQA